ncbi:hypothetical protein CAPTEDRAFT_148232 [Capitella teleta]|uniref:Transmembrane protein 214 n=1 Tax=Capitella teleta TaxID=283909 RepID=R7VHF5_CAPTE|nr:hypothetical protein CAPTEDRAFT_148232 [Capitella teleta]|eukprot:ELU18263.1 hypothetical protein CAPTEDRAFT_148232 [Capitella teleta]
MATNTNNANNQWEVVKKTSKKDKQKAATKQKTKNALDKMPRIDVSAPVKESSTIYDAFAPKEKEPQPKPVEEKKKPEKKKPNNKDKKKQSALSLEDAVALLDVNEFEDQLSKDQVHFAGNTLLWLKDLCSLLNMRLDRAPESDVVYLGKPADYPMCLLPDKVLSVLKKTLAETVSSTQVLFFDHCIQNILADIGKGSSHGYRIMVQILLRDKPDIALENLKKHLDVIIANQSRCQRCLAVLWSLGQAGMTHLGKGLKIWQQLMLPLLNIKHLSMYAIQYLETLFSLHKDMRKGYSALSIEEFFHILDLTYNRQSQVPQNLQKKLAVFYPNLKKIAIGKDPKKSLPSFFPSYLVRLVPNSPRQLQDQLLDSLVECLRSEAQCYSVWRHMYTKHLSQSGILLEHIRKNYSSVKGQLDHRELQGTIRAFTLTNEELSSNGKGSKMDGFQSCVDNCKPLLTVNHQSSFPYRTLVFLVLAACAALVAFDSQHHNGFKNSLMYRRLHEWGVIAVLSQGWVRCSAAFNSGLQWMDKHVPGYWEKVCAFTHPYLQVLWEHLYDAGVFIVNVTAPARQWINENVPIFLNWVNAQLPWLMDGLKVWVAWVWQNAQVYAEIAYSHLLVYMDIVGTWLLENVFVGKLSPENLLLTATEAMAIVSAYFEAFVQWAQLMYNQIASKYQLSAALSS